MRVLIFIIFFFINFNFNIVFSQQVKNNEIFCIGGSALIYGPFDKSKDCGWGLIKLDGKYINEDRVSRDAPIFFSINEED